MMRKTTCLALGLILILTLGGGARGGIVPRIYDSFFTTNALSDAIEQTNTLVLAGFHWANRTNDISAGNGTYTWNGSSKYVFHVTNTVSYNASLTSWIFTNGVTALAPANGPVLALDLTGTGTTTAESPFWWDSNGFIPGTSKFARTAKQTSDGPYLSRIGDHATNLFLRGPTIMDYQASSGGLYWDSGSTGTGLIPLLNPSVDQTLTLYMGGPLVAGQGSFEAASLQVLNTNQYAPWADGTADRLKGPRITFVFIQPGGGQAAAWRFEPYNLTLNNTTDGPNKPAVIITHDNATNLVIGVEDWTNWFRGKSLVMTGQNLTISSQTRLQNQLLLRKVTVTGGDTNTIDFSTNSVFEMVVTSTAPRLTIVGVSNEQAGATLILSNKLAGAVLTLLTPDRGLNSLDPQTALPAIDTYAGAINKLRFTRDHGLVVVSLDGSDNTNTASLAATTPANGVWVKTGNSGGFLNTNGSGTAVLSSGSTQTNTTLKGFGGTNDVTGSYSWLSNSVWSLVQSNNAATAPVGLSVSNNVVATSGNPKAAPRIDLEGHSWDSTAAATKTETFSVANIPQSTAGGGALLVISNALNHATPTEVLRLDKAGVLTASQFSGSGGSLTWAQNQDFQAAVQFDSTVVAAGAVNANTTVMVGSSAAIDATAQLQVTNTTYKTGMTFGTNGILTITNGSGAANLGTTGLVVTVASTNALGLANTNGTGFSYAYMNSGTLYTHGSGGERSMVAAPTAGIDGKSTGQTTIYTVDTGRQFLIDKIIVVPTTITTLTTPPTITVGKTAAAYTDVIASTALTGLTAVNTSWNLLPINGATVLQSGEALKVNVSVGAIGTAYTFAVYVIGWPL